MSTRFVGKVLNDSTLSRQNIYKMLVVLYIHISRKLLIHSTASQRTIEIKHSYITIFIQKENSRKILIKMEKVNNQQGLLQKINWISLVFITYVHIAGVIGICYISTVKWQTLLLVSQTLFWSAIGVTGGLHRLWSHRSYKAHWTIRTWLMFCTSLSNQGTIYRWSRDHRVHHKFSETDADPHNVSYVYINHSYILIKVMPNCYSLRKSEQVLFNILGTSWIFLCAYWVVVGKERPKSN